MSVFLIRICVCICGCICVRTCVRIYGCISVRVVCVQIITVQAHLSVRYFRKKAEQGKDGSKHLAKTGCKSCADDIPVQNTDQQIVQDNIERTASQRNKKSGFTATGCNEDALEIHLNHIEGKKEKEDDAVGDGRCKHLVCTSHPGKQRPDHKESKNRSSNTYENRCKKQTGELFPGFFRFTFA